MVKTDTFANRLKCAMEIRGINQTELSRRTGIIKSSICRYLKGSWQGKQDAVYSLASALDVSEAWLMGYDVEMEKAKPVFDFSLPLSDREKALVCSYRTLSPAGKDYVDETVELAKLKYKSVLDNSVSVVE